MESARSRRSSGVPAALGVLLPGATDHSVESLPQPKLRLCDEDATMDDGVDQTTFKTMSRMLDSTDLRDMCAHAPMPLAPTRHAFAHPTTL